SGLRTAPALRDVAHCVIRAAFTIRERQLHEEQRDRHRDRQNDDEKELKTGRPHGRPNDTSRITHFANEPLLGGECEWWRSDQGAIAATQCRARDAYMFSWGFARTPSRFRPACP